MGNDEVDETADSKGENSLGSVGDTVDIADATTGEGAKAQTMYDIIKKLFLYCLSSWRPRTLFHLNSIMQLDIKHTSFFLF